MLIKSFSMVRRNGAAALLVAAVWLGGGGCGSVAKVTPDGGSGSGQDAMSDAMPDGGTCPGVDLTSDPSNCGSCGHACNGGTCQASACQPVVLALGQNTPQGIAVDASNVYWTTQDGNVLKVSINGGNPTTLASGQMNPFGITFDSTRVYWANNVAQGQIQAVSIAGGGNPTTLASAQGSPQSVAISNGVLYWTAVSANKIEKLPLGGSLADLAIMEATPIALAADADAVYWSSFGKSLIRTASLTSGVATTLATDQDAVQSLRVTNHVLYWASGQAGMASVHSMPAAGGAIATLASNQTVAAVAVDDSHVYWTDDDSKVWRVPLAGGTPEAIATNQAMPTDIAIDGKNIYWINSATGGAVVKLAK